MNLNLTDKVIIVTGGAKGIGEGIMHALAAEGAIPVIIGRSEADDLKVVKAIKANGLKADHIVAELTRPEECKKAVQTVTERYGRINGVVNNAGVIDGVRLENGDYESFMASLHKSMVHYYLIAQYALPALKISKGAILNITSKTANTGQGNTSGYAASNGAHNALTREWAVELLKYGIRVNALVIAGCQAKKRLEIESKIPSGNPMTTTEEIADTVVFLLSDKSSHTTGQLIHVDGGYVHLT
jgi:L-fucose dehydrogenase